MMNRSLSYLKGLQFGPGVPTCLGPSSAKGWHLRKWQKKKL